MFLVRRVTFLEKFYLKCSQVSCQDEFRNELRQNMYYSFVIIFGVVYQHDFLAGVFLQCFHFSCCKCVWLIRFLDKNKKSVNLFYILSIFLWNWM